MKKVYMLSFLMLIVCILLHPQICLQFSLRGLQLWFEKMVPALFPFMILSGVIVRMNLTEDMVRICAPILQPLFRVNKSVIYGILMGFLCGFPMGAKVASQLYETGKITEKEAEYLLCFCNNIGPIYFLSFALPTLGVSNPLPCLLGMYGLPLLYGVILRYTLYRKELPQPNGSKQPASQLVAASKAHTDISQPDLLEALDASIKDGISSIVMLGGYMIIFNALNLVPQILLKSRALLVAPFLEITGGIGLLGNAHPLYVLCLLPFGGLCCLAQTYTIISDTPLKISKYVLHKLVLAGITIPYYLWVL